MNSKFVRSFLIFGLGWDVTKIQIGWMSGRSLRSVQKYSTTSITLSNGVALTLFFGSRLSSNTDDPWKRILLFRHLPLIKWKIFWISNFSKFVPEAHIQEHKRLFYTIGQMVSQPASAGFN
jgi:hypothetical protein